VNANEGSRRAWLALADQRPEEATAAASVEEHGNAAGFLVAWEQRAKPRREALRVDPRIIDPDGAPAWASLVLVPAGVRLPFDDLAVQEARRRVLAGPPLDGVSALMRDSSHFEGSISVLRGERAKELLRDDPFGRLFPARLLRVADGVLGAALQPAGPVIERYGSANPWPGARFGEQGT
jgi:hypothetical protein